MPQIRRIKRSDGDRRGVFANPDFVKLWVGETTSQVGSQITAFALPLVAIVTLDASPGEVGLLTAAQYAPVLLITLFAGVWLDRHRRRRFMIAANLGRAALVAVVPVAAAFGFLSFPLLCVVAFMTGLLTAGFDVAYITFMPTLVRRDQLTDANSKLEATYSVAEIGGPGLGGLLVQYLAAPFALVVDAAGYLFAAGTIKSIGREESRPEVGQGRPSVLVDIGAGVRTTLRDPVLRSVVAISSCFNLFERVLLVLYLVYGIRELGLSAAALGAIMAVGSVGAIVGSVAAGWAGRRFRPGRSMAWSLVLSAFALCFIPAASPGGTAVAVVTLLVGFVLYGFGLAIFNIHSLTIRAKVIRPEEFGRVTATFKFISHGTVPIGGLVGGILADAIGIRAAMAVAAVSLVLATLGFAATRAAALTEHDLLQMDGMSDSEPGPVGVAA